MQLAKHAVLAPNELDNANMPTLKQTPELAERECKNIIKIIIELPLTGRSMVESLFWSLVDIVQTVFARQNQMYFLRVANHLANRVS